MSFDIREIARRAAGRALAARGNGETHRTAGVHVTVEPCDSPLRPSGGDRRRRAEGGRALISAEDLDAVADGEAFVVPAGAVMTALAEEKARERRIRFVTETGGRPIDHRLRIAVGCDHGGYAMKREVLDWLRELGHEPLDLGTHDENAVDYPDYARAVAEAVAEGRCELGICVDGAGIGSAMAANKVRGVRAANCWSKQTAANAREHNYANVLTLGGRMLSSSVALDVVRTFLSTPEGEARHGRRVEKIMRIEDSPKQPAREESAARKPG